MRQSVLGFREKRSAEPGLLQRLREIQDHSEDQSLSEEVLEAVAEDFGVSMGFVHGVVTFYSMLSESPRGRHIIRVCESPQCRLAGTSALVAGLKAEIGIDPGETTPDGEFTLEFSSCLGACAEAPVLQVGDTLYTQVSREDLPRILGEARGAERMSSRRHPPTLLGEPRRLLKDYDQLGSLEQAVSNGAYQGLRQALAGMTPNEVVSMVKDAGLRGRGGAGFPTARKWEFTRMATGEPRYIVCNADEGEPGTFKDRILLEGTPHRIIEGMIVAGYAVGALEGYIYIRGEYAEGIRQMKNALEEARRANYLGEGILDSSFSFDIYVHQGAGSYVCGEETSLLESMEGKRGFPRLRPPYPASAGLWGKPTVINNVETLANVPEIVREGVDAYRSVGMKASPGTKLYPLSGAVVNTGVVEAEMGITLRKLIFEFGGGMAPGSEFMTALVGGAAGVFLGEDMLDTPLEYDSLASRGAVLGSGAILVLDKTCHVAHLLWDILHFFCHEACGQCVPCRVGTVRLVEIMDRFLTGAGTQEDLDLMLDIAETMKQTSLCPLGQSPYPMLKSAMKYFQDSLLAGQKNAVRGRS